MRNKWVVPAIGLSSIVASGAVFSAQIVVPSQSNFEISAGDTVEFTVNYTAESADPVTGLGLKLYFDSSKLQLDVSNVSEIFPTNKFGPHVINSDSSNGDSDDTTDKFLNVAWVNFSGATWPGTGAVDTPLYTVKFTATQDFSSDTAIKFTADPAAGQTFESTPIGITYKDTIAPEITAPANITIEATGASTSVTAEQLGTPTVSDNKDTEVDVVISPQGPFALGEHTITWTATDDAGNSAEATQTLTIDDTAAPTLTTPEPITTTATASLTSITLIPPSATDSVDSTPTVTADKASPFALGTHTITWTAKDASDNISTVTQLVTITEPGAPTLADPAAITKEATGSTTAVDLTTVTGADIIDGELTATADKTGPFAVGTHTITWTVTNSRNASTTATQQITITDATGPTITVPPAKTVEATGAKTPVNIGTATATDLVDGEISVVTSDSPEMFDVGSHTVTWTATDSKDNTSTAEQMITVEDTAAPTITAPADKTVEATTPSTTVELGAATASDIVDGTLTATADQTGPFKVGTHTVTWTATDTAGNKSTDTQTITITDTTAPELSTPEPITTKATAKLTPITLMPPSVTDGTDSAPTVTADKEGPFALGTHTITWTAKDASDNISTVTQLITITEPGAPTLTNPAPMTKEATGSTTAVNLTTVTGLDVIDGELIAIADKTGPFAVGTHTITWTATNSRDASTTATQTITITDTTAPTIEAPSNLPVAATGENTTVVLETATATDLVDGSVAVTSDAPSSFTIGTHTVTWAAVDAAGNSATATQIVTVSDGEGPILSVPANIAVEATGATTVVNLGAATAVDIVDGDLTPTADKKGPFVVGTHTITWSVTDSANNTETATQTVTVKDTTAPEIAVDSSLKMNATGVYTSIPDFAGTVTDLVDGSNIAVTGFVVVTDKEGKEKEEALTDAGLASGLHQLRWKATDNAGNEAIAKQTLEITPLANFFTTQAASAGDKVTVMVEMSGEAVSYPVKIPYSIDGTTGSLVANDGSDHDAANGVITIESGTKGSFSFNIAATPTLGGASKGDLTFTMGTLENAVTGIANTHKVIIFVDNIAPVVNVAMTQNGVSVTKITKDGGNVLITATATDNAAQTLNYDWSETDSTLADLTTDSKSETFELDPSVLAEGTYAAVVIVEDNGSPIASTKIATSFNVVAGEEPIADSDGDGIEDSKDNVAESNRLPSAEGASNAFILEGEPGTTLKLGSVARQQNGASSKVTLTALPAIPTGFAAPTEIHDFEISGVVHGESTRIVIPQRTALPADATYLKARADGSWSAFVSDANNIVYSAKGSGTGACPAIGDPAYKVGLTEGDYCVQLLIQDGSVNDTDDLVNGSVADPGAIVKSVPTDTADLPDPVNPTSGTISSSGKGGSIPLYLIPFFLLLGLIRRGLFRK